mmetsp:Transcript_45090/g.129178  ORF Transcript_45090/g.129178 Transcript_45090/m.129178 type:complete len:276 (+) Transcript_45090:834-1661(+)
MLTPFKDRSQPCCRRLARREVSSMICRFPSSSTVASHTMLRRLLAASFSLCEMDAWISWRIRRQEKCRHNGANTSIVMSPTSSPPTNTLTTSTFSTWPSLVQEAAVRAKPAHTQTKWSAVRHPTKGQFMHTRLHSPRMRTEKPAAATKGSCSAGPELMKSVCQIMKVTYTAVTVELRCLCWMATWLRTQAKVANISRASCQKVCHRAAPERMFATTMAIFVQHHPVTKMFMQQAWCRRSLLSLFSISSFMAGSDNWSRLAKAFQSCPIRPLNTKM